MIKLVDAKGKELTLANSKLPAHYNLPSNSTVNLTAGSKVGVGDVIARTPRETSGTRDITGGLPRVADLFEAREPKDKAELLSRQCRIIWKRKQEASPNRTDGMESMFK